MSIREAAVGILKTHVTWEEFEANLTKALNTTATFGPNKSVIDIGEGNGFASRCGLVDCDWQGEGADKLPKRVVLKMGSCMAIMDLNEMMPPEQSMFKDATPELWQMFEMGIKGMHNMECETYDFLEQFGEGHAFPKRFYAKAFNDENVLTGQICMEYIDNSRMWSFHEKSNVEQLKQIARALGKLQADSTKYEVVSEALRTKDVFGEFTKSTPKDKYVQMLTSVKFIEASLSEAVEGVEAILEEYYGATLPSTIHKQLGLLPVLVNGDMRTENVLVDKDTGDLRALIDWQCSHLGVGVEDLLRICFFAQTTEDRRDTADLLIKEMYNSFIAHLSPSMPLPFSLEQLKEVYDLLFPHCALFFATGLGVLMPAVKNLPCDEEEKQRRYDVVVDKARGVLEDIVTYHKKNKASKHAVVWNFEAA
ncbi:hypothetical protein PENTCL1PPCAC_15924 [Pristionchus entomophagus]|uniref:CHK kinase-like domain-containing protein n=1 Tax=Pristionchus entomophagus TaxID=358040 RepID=A0AAV5THE9_9BILA|nr:hypothetical protein PENTCL1PPCAC_15924 [Pristionchus entomophagus]